MRKSKRKLLLIFAGVLIGLLIPAFAFADDSSPATTFGPGDSVKVDEEHFPDPSFRAFMIEKFELKAENPVLKYDDALKLEESNFQFKFDTPNYKGFEYLAAIINGSKKLNNLGITSPHGEQPFPFDLISKDKYKTCGVEILGAGEGYKLPDFSKLSWANNIDSLYIRFAVEDEDMKLDFRKLTQI